MLKHIVMWKLKDENKIENSNKIKKLLEELKGKIPEIIDIEVGINSGIETGEQSYDVVFSSTFKDENGLKEYQKNPLHLEVAKFVGKIRDKRVVVDYFI